MFKSCRCLSEGKCWNISLPPLASQQQSSSLRSPIGVGAVWRFVVPTTGAKSLVILSDWPHCLVLADPLLWAFFQLMGWWNLI